MGVRNRRIDIPEQDTFTEMVRAHQGAIRTFLRRLTKNAALADDLAQITFIRAFESNPAMSGVKSQRSWLFKVAYRVFVDEYRKTRRRENLLEADMAEEMPDIVPGLSIDVARAMDGLKPECRAVVMLCLGHGMTHDEVARITGMPLGTVKSHITRGREKLRAFLSAYERVL